MTNNTARRVLAAIALTGAVLAFSGAAQADAKANAGVTQSRSGDSPRSMRIAIPEQAFQTLQLIDEGQWPPNDGSGTKGGSIWPNRNGSLPTTDPSGNPIQYRQWDVNHKQSGQARDSERIVTGDDGSAWYTPDLFRTFARMR